MVGEARELPRALDLSAYRILQEALTNVLRHAPGSTRTGARSSTPATGSTSPSATTGAPAPTPRPGTDGVGGHGLVGMRERARMFGGTLAAGRVDGGFEVHAHLPVSGGAGMTVRVVLVDDEAMVRVGLRMVLTAEPDIEVVGEAADGGAAVEVVEATSPDVVLMDVRMPDVDGIEGARRVLAAVPGGRRSWC